MAKSKPCMANIKNLMTRTFLSRREWILAEEVAVYKVVEEYPCLRKVVVVSLLHSLEVSIKNFEMSMQLII